MKNTGKARLGGRMLTALATLALMFSFGLFFEDFSIVSHAESQATVVANSANIRKEPNSSSEILGSTEKDKVISIKSQTTGSDGAVWYQVYVNSNTLGYIRSDLVSITDGTTPPTEQASGSTVTPETPETTQPPAAEETPAAVTAVEPVSATVTGGQSVRVRSNASTTSQIVSTAQNGLALTVTGQATGTDGNVWYQVIFIADGAEVTGFIRSDYVALSGELVPVTETPLGEGEPQTPELEPEAPQEKKDWETQLQGDKWYLIDNVAANQYSIQELFDVGTQNAELYLESQKTVKTQKIVIIILVILLVVLAAGGAFLIFKMKDMMDSAYFSEVERDTIRRRENSAGAGQRGQAGRQTPQRQGEQRPTARQAGAGIHNLSDKPGANPVQGRPAGSHLGGSRPAGASQTAGRQDISGAAQNKNRSAGAGQPGSRPGGARPAGAPQTAMRQAGVNSEGGRGIGHAGAAPAQGQNSRQTAKQPENLQKGNPQNPGWKSRNFMTDDDEFEFEFLNWDGDEEQ